MPFGVQYQESVFLNQGTRLDVKKNRGSNKGDQALV